MRDGVFSRQHEGWYDMQHRLRSGKTGAVFPAGPFSGQWPGEGELPAKDANAKGLTSDSRQPGQYRGHETIARPGRILPGRQLCSHTPPETRRGLDRPDRRLQKFGLDKLAELL